MAKSKPLLKSPAQKTDDELAQTVSDLIAVLNRDWAEDRDVWLVVSALHAHTQEQKARHYRSRLEGGE